MKLGTFLFAILLGAGIASNAQTTVVVKERYNNNGSYPEKYGHTLNLGLGIGYYGYIDSPIPVLHLNYEFDVARSFTLAPFVSFYNYRSDRFYNQNGNRYYYHETVVPIGLKGTYYFDELFKANPKWDFYLGGSLGFSVISSYYDPGYTGNRDFARGASPLFLDIHAGAEYHFNSRIGAFLDLSTGISTIGLAIH